MAGRVISISLLAIDNMSRALRRAANSTENLSKHLDKIEKIGKGVGLATLAAGALALSKAIAPATAAVAALPTAIGAAVVASTTLKIGMKGVGDAMKAVSEGDAKKLDAALKKLSPNARAFVKEFAQTKKAFDPIRKAVQERLFDDLDGGLRKLSGNLLPTLKTGMVGVSGALNGIAKEAMKTAATPWFRGAVAKVFDATTKSLNTLKGGVTPLMKILTQLVTLGAPLLQRFTQWAVSGLKLAAAFLTSASGTAKFSAVAAKSGDVLAQLGRVLLNLVVGLKNVVGQADRFNKPGQDMLTIVEQLTKKFAVWSASASGQRQIVETFRLFGDVARQIVAILPILITPLGALIRVIALMPGPTRAVAVNMLALVVVFGTFATKIAPVVSGIVAFAKSSIVASVASKVAAAASKVWAATMWVLNAAMDANPIGIVIIAVVALVAAFVIAYKNSQTFRNIVQAAWQGIQAAASWAWNTVIKPVFEAIKYWIINILIPYYKMLWTGVQVAWKGIVAVIAWAWPAIKAYWTAVKIYITVLVNAFKALWIYIQIAWKGISLEIKIAWAVIKPIWALIKAYITGILIPNFRLIWSVVKIAWAGMSATISSVWNSGIKPAFNALKNGLSTVQSAFRTAVSAIRSIWDGLRSATRAPVNFVIGLYNKGIVNLVNKIASFAGIKTRLSSIPTFATGGVMPGYAPGKDSLLAAVSPGESIFRPEFTKAVGSQFVSKANNVARTGGPGAVRNWLTGADAIGGEGLAFARGGVVPGFAGGFDIGGIVGSFVKGLKDFAFDAPEKAAKTVLGKILGGTVPGAGEFHDAIAAIPAWIKDKIFGWLKSKVGGGVIGGKGFVNALSWARAQNGKPYVWGGVGPGGYDCSGFMSAITNVIHGKSPYSRLFTTHSFGGSGGPGGFVRNQRSGFMVGVTNAGVGHMAGTLNGVNVESSGSRGVHLGAGARGYNDGLFGARYGLKADTGALTLQPGWNPPTFNGTGRPELLSTQNPNGGNNYHITVNVAPGGDLATAGTLMVKAIKEHERRNGKKWRTP